MSKRNKHYDGDPLLEPYYPGIAKVSPELAEEVIERSEGICEYPGCGHRAEEISHTAGRRRKAHLNNLKHFCIYDHKAPLGYHAYKEDGVYGFCMREYQQWCYIHGYNEDEVRYLLGTKSNRLF